MTWSQDRSACWSFKNNKGRDLPFARYLTRARFQGAVMNLRIIWLPRSSEVACPALGLTPASPNLLWDRRRARVCFGSVTLPPKQQREHRLVCKTFSALPRASACN